MREIHDNALVSYKVWDRPVRVFHWLNVLCVLALIALGLGLYFDDSLGLSSDGKILLKIIHVSVGYVFAFNLLWRVLWGFIGNRYARWRHVLPLHRGYPSELRTFIAEARRGQPVPYAGHNPMAKLMVTLLFLLLMTQAVTGLVLAGTDLYYPPFGQKFAAWVSDNPDATAAIKPGSKLGVNAENYRQMRTFRKPFITVHEYSFYILLCAIFVHIAAVVLTEIRERNGLVSAMITGDKVFKHPPVDTDDGHSDS